MKFVTFNIRCAESGDGINSFFHRAGGILCKITREKPDVIGFQEVRPYQFEFLNRHLADYMVVGCGRGEDYEDEHNCVAFLRDRFELIGLETEWLSPTPFIPGSRYEEQSSCPRIVTRVTLREFGSPKPFDVFNTHLDHVSDTARVLGAQSVCRIMEERMKKWGFPMVLMGDFNAYPGSAPLRTFMENGKLALTDHTEGVENSYHGFGRTNDPRIDYIMSRGFRATGNIAAWKDETDGIYLSDHYPLAIELDME